MGWKEISNLSSIVTILSAFFSGLFWYKTRNYYNKIARTNNLEKLTTLDKDLIDIRAKYEFIKRYHYTENKRGKGHQKIIDSYLEMEIKFNQVRIIIPSKYKEIIESINNANELIHNINENKLHLNSNVHFNELGIQLANIENGVKFQKENIRGF